jgi:hypothetical protein
MNGDRCRLPAGGGLVILRKDRQDFAGLVLLAEIAAAAGENTRTSPRGAEMMKNRPHVTKTFVAACVVVCGMAGSAWGQAKEAPKQPAAEAKRAEKMANQGGNPK